jgi:acyl carrier protein
MSTDLERTTRATFAQVVGDLDPAELALDADLVADYGLTSMNRVLFMISLCESLGVELSTFTEEQLAKLHTLGDVLAAMAERRQPSPEGVAS